MAFIMKLDWVCSNHASTDWNTTTLQVNAELNELPVVSHLPPQGLLLAH